MSLLKRMVPSGLLNFLRAPGLSQSEADALNGIEGETKVASNKEVRRQQKRSSRLANLRARIQTQFKGTSAIRSVKGENFAMFFHTQLTIASRPYLEPKYEDRVTNSSRG